MILPLLVVPFITLFLWIIGVIGPVTSSREQASSSAINLSLPRSMGSVDSNWNKLAYYNQAQKDAKKLKARQRINQHFLESNYDAEGQHMMEYPDHISRLYQADVDRSAEKASGSWHLEGRDKSQAIYRQLDVLNHQLRLAREQEQADTSKLQRYPIITQSDSDQVPDLPGLAPPLEYDDSTPNTLDPEMQQLNNMLDKVLSIQHPERINNALRERSDRNPAQVFTVGKTGKENLISLLAKNDGGDSSVSDMGNATSVTNAFYGLSNVPDEDTLPPMIPATIDQTQTLISGATVKLRLGSDVYIHGLSVPRGHLLYGKAVLQGERLGVKISHIAAAGHILPVSLTVFDIDGQPGIYIPGAITWSTLKQSSGEGIQSMNVGSFNPSVGAQAASAGIQAAKTLLGKKIRLVKVTVKAGYKVWLVDENRKD